MKHRRDCPRCDGVGEVPRRSGEWRICPACQGRPHDDDEHEDEDTAP